MRHSSLAWVLLLGALTSLSCGGSASGGNVIATIDASVGGGGGASGSTASGGAQGRGGSSSGQSGSIVISPADAQSGGDGAGIVVGGGALEDAACASELHQAEQLPLDIYIMLDISGSMEELVADGVTSKWTAVREAIRSFVTDPASAGLGVGLQYFPLVQPGVAEFCDPSTQAADCGQFGPCDVVSACDNADTVIQCTTAANCPVTNPRGACVRLGACAISPLFCPTDIVLCSNLVMNNLRDVCQPLAGNCRGRDVCDGARYAMPAVEVATLPGAAINLVNSLNARTPTGLTPTAGALSGALTHAQALATANPMHRVAVVLATDGFPTECTPQDIPGIAGLAANALAQTPSIPTFVIGVFSPADAAAATANLDALAQAGGSGRAFIIDTGPSGPDAGVSVADAGQNVTSAFLGALNTIRTAAVACEYNIPQPEAGRLDYGKVNVQFTSGTGQKTTIGYAGSAASCGTQGGWYYDVDPTRGTPSKIVVCDSTCAGFKADPRGAVKVLLGCQTLPVIR